MKIAILGSTGYIGSRIAARMIAQKDGTGKEAHEVWCVHRDTSDLSRLKAISDSFHYCVNGYVSLKQCFSEGEPFDVIINASCSYIRNHSEEQIFESNLIYPLRVMNLALQNPDLKEKIRYISIGTGLPDNFNIYTLTKKELNRFGRYYSDVQRIRFVNLELQNYYGPYENKDRFLANCIQRMANNEEVLLTTGEQHRDFVHIDDVLDAIELLMRRDDLPSYLDVPLGSGEAPTIRELISYVKQQMGSKSELRWGAIPLRQNEPSICADLSMYNLLGGEIRYDWKHGIKKILEDMNYEIAD